MLETQSSEVYKRMENHEIICEDYVDQMAHNKDASDNILEQEAEDQKQDDGIHTQACFTDNFLVFSVQSVKMPQITDIYISKEEDLLDCQQTIKFAPGQNEWQSPTKKKLDDGLPEYIDQDQDLLNQTMRVQKEATDKRFEEER